MILRLSEGKASFSFYLGFAFTGIIEQYSSPKVYFPLIVVNK